MNSLQHMVCTASQVKSCQEMMMWVNELGRKLVRKRTVAVSEFGKRPYWGGDLVGMNESLQRFSANIVQFSEQMRQTDETLRMAE